MVRVSTKLVKPRLLRGTILGMAACATGVAAQVPLTSRTPATPLVVQDPYFSIWSMTDKVATDPTRHWTGSEQQLNGWVRVDGKMLRFMGVGLNGADVLPQTGRAIWPTRTIYDFEGHGIHLTATFLSPALPGDMDVMSRPITYLNWTVHSVDGRQHDVQLVFDASAQLAVNTDVQPVVWGSSRVGDMTVMRVGTKEQPILEKAGDDLRIDWGWAQLVVPTQEGSSTAIAGQKARDQYLEHGQLPHADDLSMPRAANKDRPHMLARFDYGKVGTTPETRRAMISYDDIESIEYFKRQLPAYWRRGGMTMAQLLVQAEADEPTLRAKSEAFDRDLVKDLTAVGGEHYADLAILSYRQTLGANKLVADIDGSPMLFSKENNSNGCIDTVDIAYPTAPFFLLLNPKLLEAQLRPVMEYAQMPRWRWPFAPHDLGTYPLANGQVYGGGERTEDNQMPVEESGNMLLMIAAMAKIEGNADFAKAYWPTLEKWAAYLLDKGMDPENQLSTDDFAGHLAHNANLSAKAIVALDAYAHLARMLGKTKDAGKYESAAKAMAAKWQKMAQDGDHTVLAFGNQGSWSQKYNLVWDKLLGYGLFPPSVYKQEVNFYLTKQNTFGLPLDSRKTYTKLDWTVWSATLADNRADFLKLTEPLYRYITETPTRVPLSDWFETTDGKKVGFKARAVVGGVYIKMLDDPAVWKRWANRK